MAKKRRSRIKKIKVGETIGLVSSLIGIFAFVTNINSLSALFSGTSANNDMNTLFQASMFDSHPSSALFTAFFIFFVVLFAAFFYIVLIVYRWLAIHGFTSRKVYNAYSHAHSQDSNLIGDGVTIIAFEVAGMILWFLLVSVFFGRYGDSPFLDGGLMLIEIFGPLFIFGLILAVCLAARNAAWK